MMTQEYQHNTDLYQAYKAVGISRQVYEYGEGICVSLEERFAEIDKIAEYN